VARHELGAGAGAGEEVPAIVGAGEEVTTLGTNEVLPAARLHSSGTEDSWNTGGNEGGSGAGTGSSGDLASSANPLSTANVEERIFIYKIWKDKELDQNTFFCIKTTTHSHHRQSSIP
jgi:hypothetical protein